MWGTSPTVAYVPGAFAAPYVRFYVGDLYNNNQTSTITVHDLQVYNYALTATGLWGV